MKIILTNIVNAARTKDKPNEFSYQSEIEFDYNSLLEAIIESDEAENSDDLLKNFNYYAFVALSEIVDISYDLPEKLKEILNVLNYDFDSFYYYSIFDYDFLFTLYRDVLKRQLELKGLIY